MADPLGEALERLWRVIEARRSADPETSYTARLFARGNAKIAQKLGEEAVEAVIEGVRGDRAALVGESADLFYHLLVLWAAVTVTRNRLVLGGTAGDTIGGTNTPRSNRRRAMRRAASSAPVMIGTIGVGSSRTCSPRARRPARRAR